MESSKVSRARRMNLGRPRILTLIGAASALVSMDIELLDATIATCPDTYNIHSSSILILSDSNQNCYATTSTFSASECDTSRVTWYNRSSSHLQELKRGMASFEDDDPIEGEQPCHLYLDRADISKGRVTTHRMKTRTWTTTIMTTKKEKTKTREKERKREMMMTMTMIKMMRAIKTTMMKEMQTEKQNHHHSHADRVESRHPTRDRRIPPLC
jgi:hypothetical protein